MSTRDSDNKSPGGIRPNREAGYAEQRRDDGTSVATLGKAVAVPIHQEAGDD